MHIGIRRGQLPPGGIIIMLSQRRAKQAHSLGIIAGSAGVLGLIAPIGSGHIKRYNIGHCGSPYTITAGCC